jgi:hypothetical protein
MAISSSKKARAELNAFVNLILISWAEKIHKLHAVWKIMPSLGEHIPVSYPSRRDPQEM